MAYEENIDPTSGLQPVDEAEQWNESEDEKKLIGDLRARFDEMERHRAPYDDEVEHCRSMLRGDTLVARDPTTGNVVHITLSNDSRFRISADNVLRSINRALIGKHTRIIPTAEVAPGSGDESDVRAARIATSFWDYTYHRERVQQKYVEAHRIIADSGTAIWHPFWDRRAGGRLAWCGQCNYTGEESEVGQPCPLCEQQARAQSDQMFEQQTQQYGQQYRQALSGGGEMPQEPVRPEPEAAPELKLTREGDVRIQVIDPLQFYPEPGVAKVEDMRYACTRIPTPVTTIREMFPKMARYIKAEGDIRLHGQRPYARGYSVEESPTDYAHLYSWVERPTELYPRGRRVFVCNDIVLNQTDEMLGEDSPWWMLPTLPFYPFWWERVSGQFWGESHISQSWPLQVERNDMLADMRDQRKRTGKPPVLAPIGCGLANSDFHNIRAGTVVKYKATSKEPKFMDAPPFPPYQYNELERTRLGIQEKASVTDHEMGSSQSGESGRYAAMLEAQSAESIRPILVENSASWVELVRAVIVLGRHYYAPKRVWTVYGRDKFWSYDWSSVNLSPGWDVRILETDSLSQNPALRLEQAERLLKDGVFNDPATGMPNMARFAKVAGLKEIADAPDPEAGERSYAASIPELIIEGKFVGVRPWDDVKICDEEILSWLRGPGRSRPAQEQMAVAQVWMGYAKLAAELGLLGPGDRSMMPNPGIQQPQQQPQQQPAGPGAGEMPAPKNATEEANEIVREADQTGENAARASPHEA